MMSSTTTSPKDSETWVMRTEIDKKSIKVFDRAMDRRMKVIIDGIKPNMNKK